MKNITEPEADEEDNNEKVQEDFVEEKVEKRKRGRPRKKTSKVITEKESSEAKGERTRLPRKAARKLRKVKVRGKSLERRLKEQSRIFKPAAEFLDEVEQTTFLGYWTPRQGGPARGEGYVHDWFLVGPDSPLSDWWNQVRAEPVPVQPVIEPVLQPPELDLYINQLIEPQLAQLLPRPLTSSSSDSYEEAVSDLQQDPVTPPPLLPPRLRRGNHGDTTDQDTVSRLSRNPLRSGEIDLQSSGVINLDNIRDLPPLPEPQRVDRRSGRQRHPPDYLKDYKR